MQRAKRHERVVAPQLALHAEGHHDVAIVDDSLGERRLVARDRGVARRELLAQAPDALQIAGEIGFQRALGELVQLVAVREAALALGYVSAEDFERWVRPEAMIRPG